MFVYARVPESQAPKQNLVRRIFSKKCQISTGDPGAWYEYKQARNQINNENKKAKRPYFTKNLAFHKHHDKKKTWKLVNHLNSRNHKNTIRVMEIKLGEQVITSSAGIAETLNSYFSNVGGDLD